MDQSPRAHERIASIFDNIVECMAGATSCLASHWSAHRMVDLLQVRKKKLPPAFITIDVNGVCPVRSEVATKLRGARMATPDLVSEEHGRIPVPP